jgi:hypothetical protein
MFLSILYCCRPEHLIFHRHLLRSNISLDLANLLQVGFDLRNTLERKILSPKIKASGRQQYILNEINLRREWDPEGDLRSSPRLSEAKKKRRAAAKSSASHGEHAIAS